MTDVTLDIDTSEIDDLLRKFPALEQIIFAEIETSLRGSLAILEEQVTGRTPVNTGALRASITQIVRGRSPRLTGSLSTAIVYGKAVEYGLPPGHKVPVDQLEIWVRRKLGVSPDESGQVAFLIARAIERRGTKGAEMFQKGLEASRRPIGKLWSSLPGRVVPKMERKLK